MGSGTFPLYRTTDDAKVLLELVKKIDNFMDDYAEYVYSGESGGNQFDNAAIDGGYLEKLRIARRLISDCVTGD